MSIDEGARTTLHFIRHADAIPEPEAALDPGSGYDVLGLSAKGAAQAAALARRLAATTKLRAVYASPTRRARETADAVARASSLALAIDERLREIYLGDDSVAEIPASERARAVRERLGSLATIALARGTWDDVPGAEPANAVLTRMREAVEAIVARHADEHVAVVSHAGSINAFLADVLGISRPFFFPIGNTSLSTVRYHRGRPLVLRLNDTAHLER